jgi:agmatinase
MDFPKYYADAETDRAAAQFVITGVPYEKTSTFRHGADQAPAQIREASWNFEQFDPRLGISFSDLKVHDAGDLDVAKLTTKELYGMLHTTTAALCADNKIPVSLGGDHSITPGIVAAFPNDTAVLSLDAHMDYRASYKKDPYNHACVIRRIAEHVPVQNIAVLGIRSAEEQEYADAKAHGLFFRDAFTIKDEGFTRTIEDVKQLFKGKPVYLTLDIDVLDPAYAPGTSTPEPFGLTPFDVVAVIDAFAKDLVGFDIVEVCPPYDQGITALLAAKLVRLGISAIAKEQRE